MFGSLLKAAVGVVITPVAVVVDIVRLPVTADDHRKETFGATSSVLDSVVKNVKDAID